MKDARVRNSIISHCRFSILNYRRDGFTLIEVIVALAIFSIIVVALYSSFFISHKAVDAVDDSLLRLQESRAVLDTLKREIEASLYDKSKSYTVFKITDRDFYGRQASELIFTAFSPLRPGLSRIAYEVEEHDGKLSLRKTVSSSFAGSDEAKGIELIEEIESFTVEVKYQDKWVKTWDSTLTGSRPDEVRVSLNITAKKKDDRIGERDRPLSFTLSDIAKPKIQKSI